MPRRQSAPRPIFDRNMHHNRKGQILTYNELVREISRRLPRLKKRDVAEVLEVMAELWQEELVQGRAVAVADLGKLTVEVQQMRSGGFMRQQPKASRSVVPLTLRRIYVRFQPTTKLRTAIDERMNP